MKKKKKLEYPGVEPFYFLMLKNNQHFWPIDQMGICVTMVAPIWEKQHVNPTKPLEDYENDIYKEYPLAFNKYTELVYWYNSLSERFKDRICRDWNKLCDEADKGVTNV